MSTIILLLIFGIVLLVINNVPLMHPKKVIFLNELIVLGTLVWLLIIVGKKVLGL